MNDYAQNSKRQLVQNAYAHMLNGTTLLAIVSGSCVFGLYLSRYSLDINLNKRKPVDSRRQFSIQK